SSRGAAHAASRMRRILTLSRERDCRTAALAGAGAARPVAGRGNPGSLGRGERPRKRKRTRRTSRGTGGGLGAARRSCVQAHRLPPRRSPRLQSEEHMPDERDSHAVSEPEYPDRRHSAEVARPLPAITGDEAVPRENETGRDRVARAAGAIGPDTVTDPLELMRLDDRPGQREG